MPPEDQSKDSENTKTPGTALPLTEVTAQWDKPIQKINEIRGKECETLHSGSYKM